jgi:type II secretory pathway pseudopilin PulG
VRSLIATLRRRGAAAPDGGWSLVELMAAMAITAVGLVLLVPVLVTVGNVTNSTNSSSNANAQARQTMQQLSADIGSANSNNVCFPTNVTVGTGPSFCSSSVSGGTSGNTLRALTNVNGSCQWMQWTLAGNNELTQQAWPTSWSGGTQPTAVPVMGPISGNPNAIFSFNTNGLVVSIQVTVQGSSRIAGDSPSATAATNSQPITLQSAISLLNSTQTSGTC